MYNRQMGMSAIELPSGVWAAMFEHVLACLPEEACGLLGGKGERANLAIPVENQLRSPTRFRMAPVAQLEAMLRLEQLGLDLVAIFHSHPNGPPTPSHTDLDEVSLS